MNKNYTILGILLMLLLMGAYGPNKVINGFEAVEYEEVDFY